MTHASKKLCANQYWWLALILLLSATAAIYSPVKDYAFLNFDDDLYVTDNTHVQKGLTLETVKWAFHPEKSSAQGYWQPVTWLSHMLDCQLFGLQPGMHHLVNLCFHLLNIFLLFFLLCYMTGSPWKSLFAAAIFALHPMNVDSVAWIAERKNLLSTAFGLIAVISYVFYTKKPSFLRYCLIAFSFAISLMAKSMLVTLPFILLLLDYWPLQRLGWGPARNRALPRPDALENRQVSGGRLIAEKLPLLGISLMAIYFTVFSIHNQSITVDLAQRPLLLRISNAMISYLVYLRKMVWPDDLAVFYPFPEVIPLWQPFAAAALLILITLLTIWRAQKTPYLAIGWLWFLGTLVPVSGLVQHGLWPALADRWAYVPIIGILIMITWGIPELIDRLRFKKMILATGGIFIVIVLGGLTSRQLTHWRNDYTVAKHALAVTENNFIAHNILGSYHAQHNNLKKAGYHFKRATEINPDYPSALRNFGLFLSKQGDFQEAYDYFTRAIRSDPQYADPYIGLGNLFFKKKNFDKAMQYYTRAIQLAPDNVIVHNQMGNIYLNQGRLSEAAAEYQAALSLKPSEPMLHYNLGLVKKMQGRKDEALKHFGKALEIKPDFDKAAREISGID